METIYNNSGIYVFEGIDHVGKTTIVREIKEQITKLNGIRCESIAFPGNEARTLGNLVYDIHHHRDKYFSDRLNETSLQLLHVASHIDLIERKIHKLSLENCIILLDRFWWSTYVYGLAGSLDKKTIETVIAPEKLYWGHINIKKIFLIERKDREHDYADEKEKNIIEQYHILAKNDSKSIIIQNNDTLEYTVRKIRAQIVGE